MLKIIFFGSVFLLTGFCSVFAQDYLAGRVFRNSGTEVLAGVNIHNLRTKKYGHSDMGGNYKIVAVAGDSIVFSSAGYRADTIITNYAMLINGYDVFLKPNIVALASVQVDALSKYEADSAKRRDEYAFILDKKHPVKLMNEKREGDAPGFNFSPIGFFSKQEKQKRRLKRRLKQEEENDRQAYIDTRFSRTRVAQLTRLAGDSLQQFMVRYRPSFEFCRNAGIQEMLLYINEKLILFRKGKKK